MNDITLALSIAGLILLTACAAPSVPPVSDAAVSAADTSGTWSWRYRTYDVETGAEYPAGRAELSGRPGSYTFRLVIKEPSPCAIGSVPATVTVDLEHIVITPKERMKGCGLRRFTIRKDGAGGQVERRQESKSGPATWKIEEHERDLTAM